MKEVSEIEKEYSNYKIKSDYVESLDDFNLFLTVALDNIEEQKIDLLEEIKLNCKDQLAARIRNFFLFMFQIEEVDYYSEDNAVIEEIINYISTYIDYFNKIASTVTNENFLELTRFVDFLCEYYNEHISYFDSKRDALEFQVKGFNYSDSRNQDNREAIADFFNRKIGEYQGEKTVEKSKKMC